MARGDLPRAIADPALEPIVGACAEADSVALVGVPVESDGRRFIAALRVDGTGATLAYRKSHLGGDERDRFNAGDGPTVMSVDGWRLGMGICKDTGVSEHTTATAQLGVDVVDPREGLGQLTAEPVGLGVRPPRRMTGQAGKQHCRHVAARPSRSAATIAGAGT